MSKSSRSRIKISERKEKRKNESSVETDCSQSLTGISEKKRSKENRPHSIRDRREYAVIRSLFFQHLIHKEKEYVTTRNKINKRLSLKHPILS